jgi:hypothetical protein
MDITIRINQKEHIAYIPKVLQNILGDRPKATPNRAAVLLFSDKTSLDDAIKSLDIIKADLLHAKEMQRKKGSY